MELDQDIARFRDQGLGVTAISYDSVEILRHFADRVQIEQIRMLSDADSTIIKAFGILNTNIPADDHRHGVPFAGT